MNKNIKQQLEFARADLQSAQERIRQLEQARREDAEGIKRLKETIDGYRRREYSARVMVHELIDMALFEKAKGGQ